MISSSIFVHAVAFVNYSYHFSQVPTTPSKSQWEETPGRQKGSETPGATPSARIWDATPAAVTPGTTAIDVSSHSFIIILSFCVNPHVATEVIIFCCVIFFSVCVFQVAPLLEVRVADGGKPLNGVRLQSGERLQRR